MHRRTFLAAVPLLPMAYAQQFRQPEPAGHRVPETLVATRTAPSGFMQLGLADTAITTVCSRGILVLTAEVDGARGGRDQLQPHPAPKAGADRRFTQPK